MSSNTKWQLTGNAAELYEQFLVPTIFVPWAQHLLSKTTPRPGENILDVACGTGIVARMAKARVGSTSRVVGVDLNAGMLDVARSVAGDDLVEWIEADVVNIPLEKDVFNIAFCQQGLQFFPDKVGALREIARLLQSNGQCFAVVAQSLEQNPLMRAQVDALTKHIGPEAAAGIRAVCGLADGDEIAEMFEQANYTDVNWDTVDLTLTHKNGREFVRNGILSTPIAGIISNWSNEARNALVEDVLTGFGEYFDGKSLIFPHVSSVVSGRKR